MATNPIFPSVSAVRRYPGGYRLSPVADQCLCVRRGGGHYEGRETWCWRANGHLSLICWQIRDQDHRRVPPRPHGSGHGRAQPVHTFVELLRVADPVHGPEMRRRWTRTGLYSPPTAPQVPHSRGTQTLRRLRSPLGACIFTAPLHCPCPEVRAARFQILIHPAGGGGAWWTAGTTYGGAGPLGLTTSTTPNTPTTGRR